MPRPKECVVEIINGNTIRCPAYPEPCTYVRVCDRGGNEIAYWECLEWSRSEEEGIEVMGALIGAACAGRY